MTVMLCLSCSLGLLNRRPRAHSAGCWLSLLHLISIFSGLQLIRAQRPLRPDVAFPTTSRLHWNSTGTGRNSTGPLGVELNWNRNSIQLAHRTQLSYIIIWRPLDLWNQMFNRHQAEITVMQFRGHSLLVHHSVVYHGNFFSSSHFISQFPPTRFPLITAIRMCYFLLVHHLEWDFWLGKKVKT